MDENCLGNSNVSQFETIDEPLRISFPPAIILICPDALMVMSFDSPQARPDARNGGGLVSALGSFGN